MTTPDQSSGEPDPPQAQPLFDADPTKIPRVRIARPWWQIAAVACASVLAGAGGALTLATHFSDDNPIERVAPLGELADRANNGIERIDRTGEAFRTWSRQVTEYACRFELRASREYEICTRQLGPFVTIKTIDPDGNITREIRMNPQ